MWLPAWRRKMNPARSRAVRTSRPDRSVGSLATWRFFPAGKVSAYAASISTNSLPASVGTGSPASRQSSM
jgi:hypothetical protein